MLNVVVLTTGPLLTLDEAKAHLRVEGDDENDLIESYLDAAVLSVLDHCDQQLVPQGAEPAFRAAALLTLGDLYGRREAVIAGGTISVSPTVAALLNRYRTIRL
ncbi:head-tail connector protein [Brevundimonas balnearis]|uniref:Head-tail connector protein n=1 Tax=Brevundimonas balnearis TaxID=1572858 RepID=A0ABV6R3P9_9CAUL